MADDPLDMGNFNKEGDPPPEDPPKVEDPPKGDDDPVKKFLEDNPDIKSSVEAGNSLREIFPTIDDAKTAKEKVGFYDELVEGIKNADAGEYLDVLDNLEKDGKLVNNFAAGFVQALAKKSPTTYNRITSSMFQTFLVQAHRNGDDEMKSHAEALAEHYFGDKSFATGGKIVSAPKPQGKSKAEQDLEAEREEFNRTRMESSMRQMYSDSSDIVLGAADKALRDSGMEDEDDREAHAKNIIEKINKALGKNVSFTSSMKAAIDNFSKNNFSSASVKAAVKIYTDAVNKLIPSYMRKKAPPKKADDGTQSPGTKVTDDGGKTRNWADPDMYDKILDGKA